jgi:hypothetical protein
MGDSRQPALGEPALHPIVEKLVPGAGRITAYIVWRGITPIRNPLSRVPVPAVLPHVTHSIHRVL